MQHRMFSLLGAKIGSGLLQAGPVLILAPKPPGSQIRQWLFELSIRIPKSENHTTVIAFAGSVLLAGTFLAVDGHASRLAGGCGVNQRAAHVIGIADRQPHGHNRGGKILRQETGDGGCRRHSIDGDVVCG